MLWFHDVDTGGSPRKIIFYTYNCGYKYVCTTVFILTFEMTISGVMSSTEEKIFKLLDRHLVVVIYIFCQLSLAR